LALFYVYFSGMCFYLAGTANVLYRLHPLRSLLCKLTGTQLCFCVAVAVMRLYIYNASKTFVVGLCVGYVCANCNSACTNAGYANAAP
jgi:hypothetical protein